MRPNEEAPTADEVVVLDRVARNALVRATALAALVHEGCTQPALFEPMMSRGLRCIRSAENEYLVIAVDEKGEPRAGAFGPMDALGLAHELKQDPGFREIWSK